MGRAAGSESDVGDSDAGSEGWSAMEEEPMRTALVHIWQSRNPSLLLPLFHRRRCPTGPPAQLHSVLRGGTFPRKAAAAHKAFHDYRRVVASVRRATDTAGPFASKHTNKYDLMRILQENCNRFLEHVSTPQVHYNHAEIKLKPALGNQIKKIAP